MDNEITRVDFQSPYVLRHVQGSTSRPHRIGLMMPATNTTFESDFARIASKCITIHSQRLWDSNDLENEEFVDKVNSGVGHAATLLSMARVQVIAYGFTTGSFYKGIDYESDLRKRIQNSSCVPVVTPAKAMVDALRRLRITRVAVATPYSEWHNTKIRQYLEAHGFDVLRVQGDSRSPITASDDPMWDQLPTSVLDFVTNVNVSGAEALICPCTAWRVLEVVDTLEQHFTLPIVTANQATIYSTLRTLGITQTYMGLGRLLETPH